MLFEYSFLIEYAKYTVQILLSIDIHHLSTIELFTEKKSKIKACVYIIYVGARCIIIFYIHK